jgi:hypothetical protein
VVGGEELDEALHDPRCARLARVHASGNYDALALPHDLGRRGEVGDREELAAVTEQRIAQERADQARGGRGEGEGPGKSRRRRLFARPF